MSAEFLTAYSSCRLCGRKCGVNRIAGELGGCKMSDKIYLARAALHFWEEPVISGDCGSGAIFFSGCSLGCIFCQNTKISRGDLKKEVTAERLAEIMLELEEKGAHNINFVTPTHYAPSIAIATEMARSSGLTVPTVYNTSSYDTEETIRNLDGTVDIYLADFKYFTKRTSQRLSFAPDYPDIAKSSIYEMVKQKGRAVIKNSLIQSGVLVRILLLPGHVAEAKLCCSYLLDTFGDDIYVSLMSQYTPISDMKKPLDRAVTQSEYDELCNFAVSKGLKNGFFQEIQSSSHTFIPDFDFTGI